MCEVTPVFKLSCANAGGVYRCDSCEFSYCEVHRIPHSGHKCRSSPHAQLATVTATFVDSALHPSQAVSKITQMLDSPLPPKAGDKVCGDVDFSTGAIGGERMEVMKGVVKEITASGDAICDFRRVTGEVKEVTVRSADIYKLKVIFSPCLAQYTTATLHSRLSYCTTMNHLSLAGLCYTSPIVDYLAILKELLLKAPDGTVWYVVRPFGHDGGWSVHAGIAEKTIDGIKVHDMGGDPPASPASHRIDRSIEQFFDGVGRNEETMNFSLQDDFCIFLPIAVLKGSMTAKQAAELVCTRMPDYECFEKNCAMFATAIVIELLGGIPQMLDNFIHKVVAHAHTTVGDRERALRVLGTASEEAALKVVGYFLGPAFPEVALPEVGHAALAAWSWAVSTAVTIGTGVGHTYSDSENLRAQIDRYSNSEIITLDSNTLAEVLAIPTYAIQAQDPARLDRLPAVPAAGASSSSSSGV